MDPCLISADNPGPFTGDGNNTFLLDGAEPTLIDAGVGKMSHVAAIARVLGDRPLARLIVTHGHSDHAAGAPMIRERWPNVDARKYLLEGEEGWAPLIEGQRVVAGDRSLQVLHTPGHAADHVCLWDQPTGSVFVGDMLVDKGSVLIPAGRGGSLREYLRSLERLRSLAPVRLYPGHGRVIDRPLEAITRAIDHRLLREAQVLACVAEGVTDADAIVQRLYVGLEPGLDRAARMTVAAHIEKLREDGRIP
jgi:glyoxylase-like metal-dependent hydrolase (beta-lactamase superfamily II)